MRANRARSRSEGHVAHECRVCGAAATNSHFGVRVCRACAAFFRRTVAQNVHYACRRQGNCNISIRDRCTCRACRFKKCLDVGMLVSGVQCFRESSSFEVQPEGSGVGSSSHSSEGIPFLSRIHYAYTELQNIRKTAHLNTGNGTDSSIVVLELPKREPRGLTYAELNRFREREINLLADFVIAAFDECSLLPSHQMNFFLHFTMLEASFLTAQTDQNDVIVMPNGGFVDWTSRETFEHNDDGSENRNADELLRLSAPIQPLIHRNAVMPLRELRVDEMEFLALGALIFWSTGLPDENHETDALATTVRQRVMNDLIEYLKTFKPTEDEGLRLSKLLLLIPPLLKLVHRMQSNVEVSSAFDLYTFNQSLYEAMNGQF